MCFDSWDMKRPAGLVSETSNGTSKAVRTTSDDSTALLVTRRTPAVAHLAFGASGLGCLYTDVPDAQAHATLEAALAAGIDYVDTAPWYGAGLSESRLGEWLKGKNVTLSTKCGRIVKAIAEANKETERVEFHYIGKFITENYHSNIPVYTATAEGVRESFKQSCARLGLSSLDCLRLHDAEDEDRWKEATEGGGVEAMIDMKRQGLVREIGLGMGSATYALRYLRRYPPKTFDSIMLAGCWNLIDQDGLEVLQECQRLGVRVLNVGIFASGVLWGSATYKYAAVPDHVATKVKRWSELAAKHSVTLPQLAISFALLPDVIEKIAIGCSTPEQVAGNLSLCNKPVPVELWAEAKTLGLLGDGVPIPA